MSPKDDWEYLVCSGCRHHLISPDPKDAEMPIERRQIWMSNFSLQPLAVECKTLTRDTIDQGAQWSLVGTTHGHASPGDKAGSCRAFSLDELSELYAVCLARALVNKNLTGYGRSVNIQDSELCRKMARASRSHTQPKQEDHAVGYSPLGNRVGAITIKQESEDQVTGSNSLGKRTAVTMMPVMKMPRLEPTLVGVAEDPAKPNRTPARLLKPTEEQAPLPPAMPTADRFS